jgi:hypothetical protein
MIKCLMCLQPKSNTDMYSLSLKICNQCTGLHIRIVNKTVKQFNNNKRYQSIKCNISTTTILNKRCVSSPIINRLSKSISHISKKKCISTTPIIHRKNCITKNDQWSFALPIKSKRKYSRIYHSSNNRSGLQQLYTMLLISLSTKK